MNDGFDFDAFMKKALEGDNAELKAEAITQSMNDEIGQVMNHLSPRLVAVISRQALKRPQDIAYQNSVMNAAVFTFAAWLAACVPEGEAHDKTAESIMEGVMAAMKNAFAARSMAAAREIGELSMLGERLLTRDTNENLTGILEMTAKALIEANARKS